MMMRKTVLGIIIAICIEFVYLLAFSGLVQLYLKHLSDNPELFISQYYVLLAISAMFGVVAVLVLAMRKIVRIKTYQASYWKSAGISFIIFFIPIFMGRVLSWVIKDNFQSAEIELQITFSFFVIGFLVSLIVAAFFRKNKYRPEQTGVLDEHEIHKD